MTRFVFLFAVMLALASAVQAQTSPSCANLPNVVCANAADTLTGVLTLSSGADPLVFDGATTNANKTTLHIVDPTGTRTATVPNADSTMVQAFDCSAGQHVDSVDVATGVVSCTADSGGAHAILDGSTHSDSVAQTVSRGSLIYGNSTPKWDELVIGTANKFLHSDGTDAAWAAIAAADIGAGDIANALTWSESCTASPCTLANAPRVSTGATPTLIVVHHGLTLRPVSSCGGEGEFTIASTTLTTCGEAWSTGGDMALAYYER